MSNRESLEQEVEVRQEILNDLEEQLSELRSTAYPDKYQLRELEFQIRDARQCLKHAEWELRRFIT